MSCCRKNGEQKEDGTLDATDKIELWMEMTNYMLECADASMQLMKEMKHLLDFSKNDLIQFGELCNTLDKLRYEFSLLGNNFVQPKIPSNVNSTVSFTQSPLLKHKCCSKKSPHELKTTNENESEAIEQSYMDACFCNETFPIDSRRKKRDGNFYVCSSLKNPSFESEKCIGNISTIKQQSEEELKDEKIEIEEENIDDHPHVLKHPGKLTFRDNGVGFELFYAMKRFHNRVAQIIESTGERQTYKDLLRDVVSVAINLKKRDLNADHIVCLCSSPNTKYACVPYLAALFAGCQMNTIDMSFRVEDVRYSLDLVPPSIIFVHIEKLKDFMRALDLDGIPLDIPVVVMEGHAPDAESFEDFLDATDDEVEAFRPHKIDSLDRISIILFSSGTSGLPKGVCLSHRTMINQFVLAALTGTLHKVFLGYSPYYWISAVIFLGAATIGGCARVVPLPFSIDRIYHTISNFKVECVFLGPFEALYVLRTPIPPDVDLSCLKVFKTGGVTMKDTIFLALRKKLPDCMVTQTYGLTETAGMLLSWNHFSERELTLSMMKPASVGMPYGGFWYKVVDEETEKILGPDEPGELCVKSDIVMKGYFKRDSSNVLLKDGWLKTGDLCYYDEYHCFYVIDRLKEMIKYKGFPVNPNIIEQVLMTHPVVARGVVIGMPHPTDCEQPMGVITLCEGIDPESVNLNEIIAFTNNQLSEKQHLHGGLIIVKNIPVTATGKVKRRSLRDSIIRKEII